MILSSTASEKNAIGRGKVRAQVGGVAGDPSSWDIRANLVPIRVPYLMDPHHHWDWADDAP